MSIGEKVNLLFGLLKRYLLLDNADLMMFSKALAASGLKSVDGQPRLLWRLKKSNKLEKYEASIQSDFQLGHIPWEQFIGSSHFCESFDETLGMTSWGSISLERTLFEKKNCSSIHKGIVYLENSFKAYLLSTWSFFPRPMIKENFSLFII